MKKTQLVYKNKAGIIIGLTTKKLREKAKLPKCDTMYFTLRQEVNGRFKDYTTYIAPDELLDFAYLILEILSNNNCIPRIR